MTGPGPDGPVFTRPLSSRYRLTPAQAGAALAAAGLRPTGWVLDARAAPPDGEALLRDADLLAPGTTTLVPALAAALAVAADPARVLRVVANVPGAAEWVELRLASPRSGGPYVHVGGDADAVDVSTLDSPVEVVAVLDEILHLGAFPSHPYDPDISLTFTSWVGLLALSDVLRARELEAQLARTIPADRPVTAAQLTDQLTTGLAATDTRWAVTAAVPITPVALRGRAFDGDLLVDHLVALRILEPATGGHRVTELGRHLVELVGRTIVIGGLTLTVARDGHRVRAGEVLVYRTPTRLAIGLWVGSADDPVLTLVEPLAEHAITMLRRLLAADVPTAPAGPPAAAPAPPAGAAPVPPPAPPAPPPAPATTPAGPPAARWCSVYESTAVVDSNEERAVVGRLEPGRWYRYLGGARGWAHVADAAGTFEGWAPEWAIHHHEGP